MVKIDTLFKKGRISRITDLEIERYVNFFNSTFRDNLAHSEKIISDFPRWSIISGYYAMHDAAKLLFAKKFRLKVDFKVHKTTIELLRELIKNIEIPELLEKGYKNFINLANDLEEAEKNRTKAQYYTGTKFLREEYRKLAGEFHKSVVLPYIRKIMEILR